MRMGPAGIMIEGAETVPFANICHYIQCLISTLMPDTLECETVVDHAH